MSEIGCFGKVPAHGDFVWQGLPARFVTPWDNWLQQTLVDLKESRPEDWLDAYLHGPIWRFLLRDDALGPETWSGIILPSVDIVGRYFPFTLAVSLPRYAPLVSTQRALDAWLTAAEEVALEALSGSLSVEAVLDRVREEPLPEISERDEETDAPATAIWGGECIAGTRWEDQLLDDLIGHSFHSPCHWSYLNAGDGSCHFTLTNGFAGFDRLFTA
mgnify:CR=1 FL=1